MTSTITFDEVEFAGGMAFRFLDVTIEDYPSGGEPFAEVDAAMSRFQYVEVTVQDGSAYDAEYDRQNATIRLFNRDGTGEVSDSTTVDVDLRVMAVGRN